MLKELRFSGTKYTPEVSLNAQTGAFSIKGRSLPENVNDFYYQLHDWLLEYQKNPHESTSLEINFEYYNSSTARKLIELVFILEDIHQSGKPVNIKWFYKKGDLLLHENGEEIKSVVELPFELVEYE